MRYLSFDMSSFMWRGLLAGRDAENGYTVQHDGKDVYINSALYGFENCLSLMLGIVEKYKTQPINCILVFEGMNSKSKRRLINKSYKDSDARAPQAYEEFHKLKGMLIELWKGVGAQVMWQDFAEGDDTLAWLAENMEEDLMICTYDNDLAALNGKNKYGAEVEVWINESVATNKYGLFDFHLITTYKALVGDPSDGIKGCKGFGPAAFVKFLEAYDFDGLQDLQDMLEKADLSPLAELAETDKLIKKILEQHVEVQNSYDLAKLRPNWVNTMKHPLTWEPGMVRPLRADDDTRMKKWYGRSRLVTGDVFDAAVEWAMPLIQQSREVALDIETSTPDESDQWLAAQGNEDGVDVFGSMLTGMSITFGLNNQYTLYFSVDHADTVNCSKQQIKFLLESLTCPIIIQNMAFETVVLHNELGPLHGYTPKTFSRTAD